MLGISERPAWDNGVLCMSMWSTLWLKCVSELSRSEVCLVCSCRQGLTVLVLMIH